MTQPPDPIPFPYPQTPESARRLIRAYGLCQADIARSLGVDRTIVADLLRGSLKGHRGGAHRAAIALGLKPDPRTLYPAIELRCGAKRSTDPTRSGRGRRAADHAKPVL